MLRYFETMAPSTAACRNRIFPTSVDPVKPTKRTAGCSHNTLPISEELPVRMLNTPLGTPAFSASATSAKAVSGVSLAGFRTTVQPAASAGDTLRVIIEQGKFHGVIAPQTPIG